MESKAFSDSEKSHSQGAVVELRGISKSFPMVKAVENVTIDIAPGEILAILGENGAGKSTLMKILSGLYKQDEGEIWIDRDWFAGIEPNSKQLTLFDIQNPQDSMNIGIGMVYQHFKLVEPLTVAENIMLGKEITYGDKVSEEKSVFNSVKRKSLSVFIDNEQAIGEIRKLSEDFNLEINPKAKIEDLPIGLKQRVEILKQLYRNAQLLVLDEPTAVLTPSEVAELFKTMRQLKKAGKSLIFISHKLREPLAIADRIVVMRGGELVGEAIPSESTERSLAEMVVGRKLTEQLERESFDSRDTILDVVDLSVIDQNHQKVVNNASFTIYDHEIVGIAGVQGNGQTELVESLMGLQNEVYGNIWFTSETKESDLNKCSTLEIINHNIAYIPEDRNAQGLIQDFEVKENIWLGFQGCQTMASDYLLSVKGIKRAFKRGIMLPAKIMTKLATLLVKSYDVRTPTIDTPISKLSG
ncbi:MAG: ATP-binding cassette domain-containing protein, partial [Candidatus Heimdallarchaeota archaeon]|nr:ATP-binding cassette domain-containing protein [Candidatus Heimdallarchaeota archaeon]MCK5049699.1 ATP-binding cassette domain-containing protein [Candidatus Heimdallarchaeota archaeon]